MVFRGLVFIILYVLLIPGTYAQPAADSAAITESAELFSSEDALLALLDTIKKIEADRTSLERQQKRTSDTAASQQIQEELQSHDYDL